MFAPKLHIHSKSLFLTHQADKVFRSQPNGQGSASGFFKCLLISRQFLRASQMYEIYKILIEEFYDNHKYGVTFAGCSQQSTSTEILQLELEEIWRLNQLLNVQYVFIRGYIYNHMNEYSAVCKIFTGQITLCLMSDQKENEVHHYEILKQLQNQLHGLRCYIQSLTLEVPNLDLLFCALLGTENFYQLKQLLIKHRIRDMIIGNDDRHSEPKFDETIDEDYFDDFPTCPRIKKLNFGWRLDETHDIVSKLTKMVRFFPNLANMECRFNAEPYASEQFSIQQLVSRIINESRIIEQLQKACPPSTSIKLVYVFRIHKPESLKSVKQMVKHVLKTTNFNQLKFFDHAATTTATEATTLRTYYYAHFMWKEPKLDCNLGFEGELNPITSDDQAIEDDDHLLVYPPF